MQRKNGQLSLVGLLIIGAMTVGLHSQVLLDDQFTDGEHDTQSLSSSANWTRQTTGQWGSTDASGLYWSPTASSRAWAYFTTAGSPQTLGIGEKMTLSFSYTYTNTPLSSSSDFRFGLFNSGDTSFQTTDGNALTHTNLKGYTAQVNPGSTSGAGGLYAEDNAGNSGSSFTATGGGTYTQLGSNITLSSAIGTTTRTATLEVTRNSSNTTVSIDFGVGGTATSVTDSALNLSSFDAVAFFHGADSGNTLRIDNVKVEYTAVPEPGVMALLVMAGVCGLGLRRRRW